MRRARRISFGVSVDFPFPQMYRKLTATSRAVARPFSLNLNSPQANDKDFLFKFLPLLLRNNNIHFRECIESEDFYRIFLSLKDLLD